VKVDVDANHVVARRYGIQGIPTIALFRDGQAVAQAVGAKTPSGHRSRPRPHRSLTASLSPHERPWVTTTTSPQRYANPDATCARRSPTRWSGFAAKHAPEMADGAIPTPIKQLVALVVGS
jgi:Thioredoxin